MMSGLTRMLALAIVVAGCAKGSERSEKPAAQAGATSGPTTSSATTSSATTPVTATSAPARPLPTATSVPTTLEEWERFDYSSSVVPAVALTALPLGEVQRIRGIIFGKHGRVFRDTTIQHWLSTRPWYHEDLDFTNARLSEGDRQNLEVVREAEAAKHTQIETGDMRFYENRVITTAMLGDHPPQDWEVLEAEVLANHGYVFAGDEEDVEPDEKHTLQPDDLQKYFNERYWYRRDPNFAARQLSAIEQQNLDTIALAIMRQNKRSVSPGVMRLFQSTALTEPMLNNVNLADLRLLRNEIYALHGRPFQTGWIAQAFREYPWYKPRADYSDTELSTVERANIALITKREEELHQDLATKMLTRGDVMGLRPEDARRLRNEIYARHGRRFQDQQLRRYFASFSWYKPNDSFRESQLSATERLNAELISQYEHGKFTEG